MAKRFKQTVGQKMGQGQKFRGSAQKENQSMRSDRAQRLMYGLNSKQFSPSGASKTIKKDSPSYVKGDMIKDKHYGKHKENFTFNE